MDNIIGFAPGTVKRAEEIGYGGHAIKYILVECPGCGKKRWTCCKNGKARTMHCYKCAGKMRRGNRSPFWKGGKLLSRNGYTMILLSEDNPYFTMANPQRYLFEHRLAMAQHLGRCLTNGEIVHHINHDKQDNRIENLELTTPAHHLTLESERLTERVKQLETENRLLREEISRLQKHE